MARKIPKSILPEPGRTRGNPGTRRTASGQDTVSAIAAQVRDTYIRCRRNMDTAISGRQSRYTPGPHWDGGVTRQGVQRPNIWERIAKFCLAEGVDPYDYVQYLFLENSSCSPPPNVLLSSKYLTRYKKHAAGSAREVMQRLTFAFENERSRLLSYMGDWRAVDESTGRSQIATLREALGSDRLALTPLFRFCVAWNTGQKDIAKHYLEAALVQFLRYPAEYKKLWEGRIPAWFEEAAGKLRGEIASQEDGEWVQTDSTM